MSDHVTTYGEKLVGLTFNPSGDPAVQKAKEMCAALADTCVAQLSHRETDPVYNLLFENAICQLLNAQMAVVKLLTYKP